MWKVIKLIIGLLAITTILLVFAYALFTKNPNMTLSLAIIFGIRLLMFGLSYIENKFGLVGDFYE